MVQRRNVNDQQRAVLSWILDGCPDGVMTRHTYKTTAVALQTRGLVSISKKGGVWSATATDAGRYFAEHATYPPEPGPAGTSTRRARSSAVTQKVVKGHRPAPASRPVEPDRDEVQCFITGLAEGDGTLTIKADDTHHHRALVQAAHRFGIVPDDKLLRIESGRRWDEQVVRYETKPAWMTAVLDPIPVADRLVKPHPAVAALKADKTRLRFKPETRQRALLLLDALAKEARSRGYTVPTDTTEQNSRRTGFHGLTITIDSNSHSLRVTEQTDKTPHTPTVKELAEAARPFGYKPPKYDHHPSGRLTINVDGYGTIRQANFSDTKTINLADRLPGILQEIELRAAADEQRRIQREQEAAERQRAWEQIRDQAVLDHAEHTRIQILDRQAADWQHSRDLADYLTALRAHIDTLSGEEREAAEVWHAWATAHAQRLNPLGRLTLQMPTVPKPTGEHLKPFMRGHSSYSPRGW